MRSLRSHKKCLLHSSACLSLSALLFSHHALALEGTCLEGQRNVAFSTNQGTITNLDVSPDGDRIAFDILGDIYVLPVSGGRAVRITRGLGWDLRPVWSPDGKWVAFISDRTGSDQVFTVAADGTGHILQVSMGSKLQAGDPEPFIGAAEWTADSRAIVVRGLRFPIDSGATQGTKINGGTEGTYHGNGEALYNFRPPLRGVASARNENAVWKLDSENNSWRDTGQVLRFMPASSIEAPLISRDGRWFVFKERSQIHETNIPNFTPLLQQTEVGTVQVVDRETGARRVLLGPGLTSGWRDNGKNGGSFPSNGRYAITPDSRFLIVAYGGGVHKVDLLTGNTIAIEMSIDIAQCLDPVALQNVEVMPGPTLSVRNMRGMTKNPSGNELLFSALRRLYVVDVRQPLSVSARLLAPQPVGQFQPAYSPDGKWIAYVTWSENEGGHLWRVLANGGVPERLTDHVGYYQTPTWSPDGKRIAFVASDDVTTKRAGFNVVIHGGSIRVLSIADRIVHELPVSARLGNSPSFSSDGSRIFYAPFTSESDTEVLLSSIRSDGSAPRKHNIGIQLPDGGAAAAVPSPDGLSLVLVKHGDLYLLQCKRRIDRGDFTGEDCREARITTSGAYDPRWRAKGKQLEWSFADTHYQASTTDLRKWIASGAPPGGLDDIVESRRIQLVVPRKFGHGKVVLSGARIITMRGDEVLDKGAVLVHDGRIMEVGPLRDFLIPDDAQVINLSGRTLMPGFVDAHAHLNGLPRDLLDQNHPEALAYLAWGVTTAKNPSQGGDHAYTYAELVQTGQTVGPRLFGTDGLTSNYESIESLDDALGIARRTQRLGGTYLKYHTGWNRGQRRWIMEAARATGLGVAAHWPVSNYFPGRLDLSTVLDGTTTAEHEFSASRGVFSDVVQFLALSRVSMNFSPLAYGGGYAYRYWDIFKDDARTKRFHTGSMPRARELPLEDLDSNGLAALARPKESSAKLIATVSHAGGNITIGSHGNIPGIGFHLEMWAHVRGGMTAHEVLRAATIKGAQATGIDEDLGSIEVGKLADFIILGENPLDNIRNTVTVEQVMQNGILRDAKTLDEIWPSVAPLPEWSVRSSY